MSAQWLQLKVIINDEINEIVVEDEGPQYDDNSYVVGHRQGFLVALRKVLETMKELEG